MAKQDDSQPVQAAAASRPPGQIVIVLQGGGALGAYQAGVYQGLQDAAIEPDWLIGTSIGAINAAIIAGNSPANRLPRLRAFWGDLGWRAPFGSEPLGPGLLNPLANLATLMQGVPGFFAPNPASWWGLQTPVGIEQAAFYSTAPLKATLGRYVDFDRVNAGGMRLTVGAVSVRTAKLRYFDTRRERLTPEHIMASGALPPGFPAVRIEAEPYWDAGVYSNSPIEAVLDDEPRRSSTIFAVQLWNPEGPEPESIWQALTRLKDIQYASRADSHIRRQQQIHRLRHVISELAQLLPPDRLESEPVRQLAAHGCRTTMHIVRLLAPPVDGEDHTKDIDFTPAGIAARWQAGYEDVREVVAEAPWTVEGAAIDGIHLHDHASHRKAG